MRKNNLRYESERDRLVALRTKVDKDAAEAVQAWAEIWQCTEYAAVRTLIYAGLGRAMKECECDPIVYTRTKNACKKGTPSARDSGNAAKECKSREALAVTDAAAAMHAAEAENLGEQALIEVLSRMGERELKAATEAIDKLLCEEPSRGKVPW